MATNSEVTIARFNGETGETVIEKPTAETFADISAMLEDQRKWQADYEVEMLARKTQREALLQKLGISEEEARLLLG